MDKSQPSTNSEQPKGESSISQQTGLPEHYHVIKMLGEGGMGEVLLAQDIRLNRKVAIKRLKTQAAGTEVSLAVAEAQILARLNHTHIVQLYDIITTSEQVYLVMEYVDGTTLFYHQKTQILSLEQKLTLLIQVANGIAAAHQCGVIHCDLKPANILLDKDQQIKITDFGIARITHSPQTATHADTAQSHASMTATSPEQLKGEALSPQSDLFAFGVLAYELISARHPFGKTQLRERILQGKHDDAAEILPALPEPLIHLLNQLLSVDPEKRPANARQVAKRLEQILIAITQNAIMEQETVPFEPDVSAPVAPQPPHTQPNKRAKFLAIIACSLMFVAILVVWLFSQPPQEKRYVLVLKPQLTLTKQLSDERTKSTLASVDHALRQLIIDGKHTELIAHRPEAEHSLLQLATTTGATDIISTELTCSEHSCETVVKRLGGEKWTVQQQISWPMALTSEIENFYSTQAQAVKLFPDLTPNSLPLETIRQQDYLSYLQIYQDVSNQGAYNLGNLDKLRQVLTNSPYLFAAYGLYSDISLTVYDQTKREELLTQLRATLRNAPARYKQKAIFNKEMMLLALTSHDEALFETHLALARARHFSVYDIEVILSKRAKQQGDLKAAIAHLHEAMALRKNTSIMFNLANTYYQNGQFERAKHYLNEVLTLSPDDYLTNQLLADIHLAEGHIEQAIERYEKVVSVDPQPFDINVLALCYTLNGQFAKALETARPLSEIENNSLFLLNLADIEKLNGNMHQANQYYQQVIERNDSSKDFYDLLDAAQAHAQIGNHEPAVTLLNEAIKQSPDNSEYAFTAALVYTQIGELTSALVSVKAAMSVGYGVVWFNLPWFKNLCQREEFVGIVSGYPGATLCTKRQP
ncbi:MULTISPECIES: serine/threonine-protein kinase [unclassified Pseudoalteromonas]|uniref:serine/threonine-protein kinase n=1 Tax=unclassified Pseudoalteromonas TaxID=194690 RepID=UPI002097D447|nr:serine/threonine-protein kinase [Pseudoalteromonas sp. XMcav2-N]MCO7188615.1 protein kinase [Pseudoalteromonas sp. XMcav2-N]